MLIIIFLCAFILLAYHRASLSVFTLSFLIIFFIAISLKGPTTTLVVCTAIFLLIALPLNLSFIRRKYISQRLLQMYREEMPAMSRTEREAISAGTVTWEGDLFRGDPDWFKLIDLPAPMLSAEEVEFLSGPVETLCKMVNDWEITHELADLPVEIWNFLKSNGFFALIIPKAYGGKAFSAFAHSQIIAKLSGLSVTLSSTVAVPNSLGPAELLLHYGTKEQKDHYLPRLARGEDIPCFALTSPNAGSDAGAMCDYGIVGYGEFKGEQILGLHLNFNKRYITLAPIATVIGLAFKMYDPEHLIGTKKDIGITCALLPRETPGLEIGRRHFPLNCAFLNGPVQGKNIFVPLDFIIGGVEKAGQGWKMLMECLAVGRSISLPASSIGGAKALAYTAGAYARIRKQFNLPIGKFEGIEAPLARIGAYTYLMDAAGKLAVATIDNGEKPSVASAIVKYHVTELGRKLACDGMDIFGGKGICLGPNNLIGRTYQASPIAITVEGANILTRNMIIFGQGAMRCHPYVLPELEAAKLTDEKEALRLFDRAVMKHIGYGISNVVRTIVLGLTHSWLVKAPASRMQRTYQHATRLSSALALMSDVAMLILGGSLKRRESISARLGDVLSHLYLLSAALKKFHEEGEPTESYALMQYASLYCLFQTEQSLNELIVNFPNRLVASFMRIIIFPFGLRFTLPRDKLQHKIAQLFISPTQTRAHVANGIFMSDCPENPFAQMQDAFLKSIEAEPFEKIIKAAKKAGDIEGYSFTEQAQNALLKNLIDNEQFDICIQAELARNKIIAVDDFAHDELARR